MDDPLGPMATETTGAQAMNFLSSYLIEIKVALAAAMVVAALAGLQWFRVHEQNIGRDEVTAQWNAVTIKAEQAARVKEQAMQSQLQKAINEHQERETALAHDVASTRATADSLRHQLAASRRDLSHATRASVDQYAATLGAVFAECTARYSELAEQAQGIASDAKQLSDAWPR